MSNYAEFLLSSQIFWGLIEGHASEMAAKRTAMENATKNAGKSCDVLFSLTFSHAHLFVSSPSFLGEIIVSLTMKYNRTRQAVITNELVDIITGASAL